VSERLIYDDDWLRRILREVRTIAMVGASQTEMRPSYFAMLYLQKKGYTVWPVNPRAAGETILGEKVFRRSSEAGAVVDDAIRLGIPVIWMQLGVRDDAAAARAEANGHRVVMDRCPKIEYGRLLGEIGWLGVNRGVVSAKRSKARQLKGGPDPLGRDGR
jgi:predicted CoA-binding protein